MLHDGEMQLQLAHVAGSTQSNDVELVDNEPFPYPRVLPKWFRDRMSESMQAMFREAREELDYLEGLVALRWRASSNDNAKATVQQLPSIGEW